MQVSLSLSIQVFCGSQKVSAAGHCPGCQPESFDEAGKCFPGVMGPVHGGYFYQACFPALLQVL